MVLFCFVLFLFLFLLFLFFFCKKRTQAVFLQYGPHTSSITSFYREVDRLQEEGARGEWMCCCFGPYHTTVVVLVHTILLFSRPHYWGGCPSFSEGEGGGEGEGI